jgi:hypothetical protein
MSLMKRYASDIETLSLRAGYAAWQPTSTLRMAALREVLEDCVTAAKVYANPRIVTQIFISVVTKEFMRERTTRTYREAV